MLTPLGRARDLGKKSVLAEKGRHLPRKCNHTGCGCLNAKTIPEPPELVPDTLAIHPGVHQQGLALREPEASSLRPSEPPEGRWFVQCLAGGQKHKLQNEAVTFSRSYRFN